MTVGRPVAAPPDRAAAPSPPAADRPRRRGSRPAPLGAGLRRIGTVTATLALAEFKIRYLESVLSYLWVMMGPLAFFGILYAAFSQVGGFDNGVKHYPLYLLTSLVLWTFFATATTRAVDCLVREEALLRKLPLPHVAVPLSVVLSAAFDLCANLVVVFAFLALSGISPTLSWLELPLLALLLALLVTGAAMLLAAIYVRHRDLDQIWVLVRQALFYGSPILYVVTRLPDKLERPALANPLATAFTEARHALLDPAAPTAVAAIGGPLRLMVPLAVVFVTFAVGLWVFRRESPRVVENL